MTTADIRLVVADGRHARFFSTDAKTFELDELPAMQNANDADGRHEPSGVSDSGHHAEERLFAVKIAEHLATELNQHLYKDLVLVGAPRLLGDLRAALSKQVGSHVTASLPRDLVSADRKALSARLRSLLGEARATDPD